MQSAKKYWWYWVLEEMEQFKYLGATLTATNISVEVLHGMTQIISGRNINKDNKMKIDKTVIRPIVAYGSTRVLAKGLESKLHVFE